MNLTSSNVTPPSPPSPLSLPSPPSLPKTGRKSLVGLLLLTALVRGGLLLVQSNHLKDDPDAYRAVAEILADSEIFAKPIAGKSGGQFVPTAIRPPLYPVLLSMVAWDGKVTAVAAGLLNWLMGIATVAALFRLTTRWGLGHAGVVACLLVALDPLLLHQSTLVMTETIATLMTVLVLVALTELHASRNLWWAIVCGAVMAATVMCRPTFLAWLGLVLLTLPFVLGWSRRTLWLYSVLGLSFIVGMTPWTARNWLIFDKPIFATTHGGYTLLLGNNHSFYHHLKNEPWGAVWEADNEDFQAELAQARRQAQIDYRDEQQEIRNAKIDDGPTLSESEYSVATELLDDRGYYEHAFSVIQAEPATFAYSCAVRVTRFWTPLPHRLSEDESTGRTALRYGVAVWESILLVCGLLGLIRLKRAALKYPWLWGLLLCFSFTLVHTFYWSNIRMRAPLIPVVCMLAASCLLPRGGATDKKVLPNREP